MNVADLIDVIRVLHDLPSDGKAGKFIGATRQEVSNWRNGYTHPTAYHRCRIAEATDMTREEIDAIIELHKEKNPIRREYWLKVLGSAAIVILTVVASLTYVSVDSAIMLPNELLGALLLVDNNRYYAPLVISAWLAWTLYRSAFPYKLNGNLTHDNLRRN